MDKMRQDSSELVKLIEKTNLLVNIWSSVLCLCSVCMCV